ncbi:MAG: dihydroneopterin aldolase [Leptospirillia bacterium]
MPSDRLTIHDIRFTAPCGVFPEERQHGMDYRADLTLHLDLAKAATSDQLEDAVNYAEVADTVMAVAKTERMLVEGLASDIAEAVLAGFPVQEIEVAVTKLAPPVAAIRGGVTVTLQRPRRGTPGNGK